MELSGGMRQPVVVVGAGAAGLMAAVFASMGPRPVQVLEGTDRPAQKILISGGGHCNVLPMEASPSDFITDSSPHTLARILRAWPLESVRRFFEEELAVPLRHDRVTGKSFPASGRARTVVDALLTALHRGGVSIRLNARVTGLCQRADGWDVLLATGEVVGASAVILATGGLSVPATGSDGTGLRIAEALGHSPVRAYPALVPLTGGGAAHHALAGVSLPVTLRARQARGPSVEVTGGFLFTHRGYSGPAVLNLSHLAARALQEDAPWPAIRVQWTPLDVSGWQAMLRGGRGSLMSLLRAHMPERLAALLLAETALTSIDLSQLDREARNTLVEALANYPLPWSGHEGFRVAEVTGGGVPLAEIKPATLESRLAPGLYLCGEMLDAFGPIGGYNFLWAWVTGRVAGLACSV